VGRSRRGAQWTVAHAGRLPGGARDGHIPFNGRRRERNDLPSRTPSPVQGPRVPQKHLLQSRASKCAVPASGSFRRRLARGCRRVVHASPGNQAVRLRV